MYARCPACGATNWGGDPATIYATVVAVFRDAPIGADGIDPYDGGGAATDVVEARCGACGHAAPFYDRGAAPGFYMPESSGAGGEGGVGARAVCARCGWPVRDDPSGSPAVLVHTDPRGGVWHDMDADHVPYIDH